MIVETQQTPLALSIRIIETVIGIVRPVAHASITIIKETASCFACACSFVFSFGSFVPPPLLLPPLLLPLPLLPPLLPSPPLFFSFSLLLLLCSCDAFVSLLSVAAAVPPVAFPLPPLLVLLVLLLPPSTLALPLLF